MGMAAREAQFHVLAVDDSLIDRKLIERLLKTSSYQVTTVDSGSKALEFLGWNDGNSNEEAFFSTKNHQEMEVNLVITDYCMPGMTGYDLLKKIKESSVLRDIPVVIMSSENDSSRINRCLEEGAEEFFLKPVKIADVNKLKPHIMKTKGKESQKPENEENQENEESDENQENDESGENKELLLSEEETETETETEIQSQQTAQSNNNNSKRKSMDEGLSQDRTRPRYNNGLTVMSN